MVRKKIRLSILIAGGCFLQYAHAEGEVNSQKRMDEGKKRALAEVMHNCGYVQVPLEIEKTKHLCIHCKVNGKPARFLVDTGSSNTILSSKSATRLGMEMRRGNDPRQPGHVATMDSVKLGTSELKNLQVMVFDGMINNVNRYNQMHKQEMVDGILGSDLLEKFFAVIDYRESVMYVGGRETNKQ